MATRADVRFAINYVKYATGRRRPRRLSSGLEERSMTTPIMNPPAVTVTYVGGPTVAIDICGMRFVTDPTFDAPGPYRSGTVDITKVEGPAIALDALGRIDLVLLSHDQHPDNLDRAGRELVGRVPTVTTPAGAARLGEPAIGLAPWATRTFETPGGCRLKVTATPARHGPAGIEPMLGDVTGFMVSALDPDRDLVYVTGDTVWYEGTAEIARRFSPLAVVLFAGAARSRGPFHLTADTNDAVEFATAFRDAAIVPVHHAGWAHFTESQADLLRTFEMLRLTDRIRPVAPAATITVSPPR
jgi:L-ascorbate metabolism protein UlaG (beta-lactamase superfamily)